MPGPLRGHLRNLLKESVRRAAAGARQPCGTRGARKRWGSAARGQARTHAGTTRRRSRTNGLYAADVDRVGPSGERRDSCRNGAAQVAQSGNGANSWPRGGEAPGSKPRMLAAGRAAVGRPARGRCRRSLTDRRTGMHPLTSQSRQTGDGYAKSAKQAERGIDIVTAADREHGPKIAGRCGVASTPQAFRPRSGLHSRAPRRVASRRDRAGPDARRRARSWRCRTGWAKRPNRSNGRRVGDARAAVSRRPTGRRDYDLATGRAQPRRLRAPSHEAIHPELVEGLPKKHRSTSRDRKRHGTACPRLLGPFDHSSDGRTRLSLGPVVTT